MIEATVTERKQCFVFGTREWRSILIDKLKKTIGSAKRGGTSEILGCLLLERREKLLSFFEVLLVVL